MKKWIGYVTMSLIAMALVLGLGTVAAQAAYTEWSEWSVDKPTGIHAQVEERKVPSIYHMEVYCTQEAKSPYYRNIRDYSIGGRYSSYGARASYGEFHYTKDITASVFAAAKSFKSGSWIQDGVPAYNRGNSIAYYLGDGDISWFVRSIDYSTEYRYRDILISITDPVVSDPIQPISIDNPEPVPAPTEPNPTVTTPSAGQETPKVTEITDTQCSKDGIKITWKAVNGVTGYYIYRDGKKIATINNSRTCTYLDKKAKENGKAYKYSISIYIKSGSNITKGKKCAEIVVVYLTVNIAPKTSSAAGSINITWKPNKKAMGYEIWYGTNKKFKNCKKILVKGGKTKSKKLTGLESDTIYYIKIRVYYVVGGSYSYSPFCPVFHAKTKTQTYQYKGIVTNAQDGKGLKNAKLYFRQGSSNKNGKVYKTCKTDSKGCYKITLPKGTYTVQVQRKNFVTIYITIYVYVNSPSYESNTISISKPLEAEQYRIVLTWGESPKDLDAHLTGSSNAYGGRYHIYFAQKNAYYGGKLAANLDVDDVNSYGPETVTINLKVQKNGTYNYYVHDFTNRFMTSSTSLGNSGARVMVYKGNLHIATYKVPKKAGTAWHVFTIENGKLIKKNTMSYVQDHRLFK